MAKEFHLKYRPKDLTELVGQPSVVSTLQEMLKSRRVPHSLLLSGTTGCGKTTTARILKKALGCSDLDFQEINCADFRGIDMVRELRSGMTRAAFSKCRIYVIDEVHAITKDAQTAFLKILEDTPDHVYFVLCSTDPNKLLPTLRNRCTHLAFNLLSPKDMTKLITATCGKEGLELSEAVVERIVEVAEGSARMGMNLLNRVAGLADEDEQLAAILKSDTRRQAFDLVRALLYEKPNWANVAKILNEIEEEAEGLRRLILSVATKECLKGGKSQNRAYLIIVAFEQNFFDSGKAGLVRACYEVVNGR